MSEGRVPVDLNGMMPSGYTGKTEKPVRIGVLGDDGVAESKCESGVIKPTTFGFRTKSAFDVSQIRTVMSFTIRLGWRGNEVQLISGLTSDDRNQKGESNKAKSSTLLSHVAPLVTCVNNVSVCGFETSGI